MIHPVNLNGNNCSRYIRNEIGVINQLKQKGATIIIITHDLDLMANADYMIDLGPKGGAAGGQLMGSGAPKELVQQSQSLTVSYLKQHFEKFGMLD
jgi:excinuclease ABC subunit A